MRGLFKDIRWPLLVFVLGLVFLWSINHFLFQERGYRVVAVFRDVAGLTPKSDVKIAGVNAGTVTKIVATANNTATITMVLPKGAAPIGSGASAQITPVNLLGEKYVDLNVGNLKHPMPSGTTIPVSRTSQTVDLDQVLDMLDPDTRQRLGILINEAGIALDGRGTNFNQLLGELPPSLQQANQLISGLGADDAKLAALIDQGDAVVTAMSNKRTNLQSLVDQADGALHVVANNRANLGRTLVDAPATLQQADSSLNQLTQTAKDLRPTAVLVQKTAPVLNTTLATLPSFTADAVPALNALRTASPELEHLSAGALAPVESLRPTATQLASFSDQLAPLTQILNTGVATNLLRFTWGWARTTQQADGLGHIFGLRFDFNNSDVVDYVERLLAAEGNQAAERKSAKSSAKAPATSAPSAGSTPLSGVTSGVGGALSSLGSGVQKTLSNVGSSVNGLVSSLGSGTSKLGSGVSGTLRGLTGGGSSPSGGSRTATSGSTTSSLQSVLNYLVGP